MTIYLQCEGEEFFSQQRYTIEIKLMGGRRPGQFAVGTETSKLQVRLTKGHYNYFNDYENNEWIETWSNVTRIRFGLLQISYDEYSMQLFHMNESIETTLPYKIRINKRTIEKSAKMHPNPKHSDEDEWGDFNWYVRMEGKDFICENKPVKNVNRYIQPARVQSEEEEDPSSEMLTIESLLKLPKKPVKWTYYDVLGISSNSTYEEITRAYKSKARRWHPDKINERQKEDQRITAIIMTQCMKLIGEAHEILKNPTTRNKYDQDLANNSYDHLTWNLENLSYEFYNPYIVFDNK
jgi:hypothetical protein